METKVRSNSDLLFDLGIVRRCLEIAKPFIAATSETVSVFWTAVREGAPPVIERPDAEPASIPSFGGPLINTDRPGIVCAFCGKGELLVSSSPEDMMAAMAAHIVKCDQHPMHAAVHENVSLRILLSEVLGLVPSDAITDELRKKIEVLKSPVKTGGSSP
jgi:hypothetical protein